MYVFETLISIFIGIIIIIITYLVSGDIKKAIIKIKDMFRKK